MRTRVFSAISMVMFAICICTVPACTKKETPEEHRIKMIRKSFEESKKAVAAQVNGVPISEFLVFREMNAIAPQYMKRGAKPNAELNARIRRDALENVITQELAVQEARKAGLTVPPEVVDGELKRRKEKSGSDAAFKEYLRDNGLTADELRTLLERDALFEMIATREVDQKVKNPAQAEKRMREWVKELRKNARIVVASITQK